MAAPDETLVGEAIKRNVTLSEAADPARIAGLLRGFAGALEGMAAEDILAARIALP